MKTDAEQLRSSGDRWFDAVNAGLLSLVVVVVLYPLVYVASASVSSPHYIASGDIWLWPKGFTLESYIRIFRNADIMRGYGNTILYTLVGTAINLTMTIMAAYPLSRKDFRGRNPLMLFILFTMFFSGGLIPTYLLIRELGMLNTFWVMVVPNAVAVWNIVIMRTFFQVSIPWEIQESAAIDGCSVFQQLLKIVLPLSMPIIAVMILFYGVSHWNAYFNALLYLSDRSRYPMQLILREILVQSEMSDMLQLDSESFNEQLLQKEALKYAVILVANLPVLLLYPFLQKYFVKGMLIGAVKG